MRIHHFITELFSRMGYVKLLHIFIFCIFAFCACGQKDGVKFIDEEATHKTRVVYEKGVCILKERLVKTDTGYANDGIREAVLDDGKRLVEFYKVGIRDSVILVFYSSGMLQDKMNVYRGGIVGPVQRYFPDGSLQAYLWFIDPTAPGKNNEAKWSILFDSTRAEVIKKGHPIVTTLMGESDSRSRDSVSLSFFFAPSPDSFRTFFLITTQVFGENTVDTFTSFNEFPPMKMMELKANYPFHKDAKYSGIYLLLDNKNRIVVTDTAAVEK
jgi:hypothetical protein